MDEIRVKLDKENLLKSTQNPQSQGKVLVFDIIKKSKPLPFEAHITIERVNQQKPKLNEQEKRDFIKIETKKEIKFEKSQNAQNEQTISKETEIPYQKQESPQENPRYRISGQKSFRLKNFAVTIRFGISAILVALIVPLSANLYQANLTQEYIKGKGKEFISDVVKAASSLENKSFSEATLNFSNALEKLVQAQEKIDNLSQTTTFLLASLPVISTQLTQGEKLLQIAKNLTEMGQIFSMLIDKITSISKETIKFSTILPNLKRFNLLSNDTQQLLNEINFNNLPPSLGKYESKIKEIVEPFQYLSRFLNDFLPSLEEALGINNPRTYLLIFQNPSEIRPTGGFIGSYGFVIIDDGIVKKFKIDDVYNIDGQLRALIIPPQPIQKISAAWSFHDANWFFDFPSSAKKLQWFYEKTGGETTDGVIAITPALLKSLLKITGPIYLKNHEALITEDNFIDILQYEVEVDYDKNLRQPKTILADLGEEIIKKFAHFTINDLANFFSEILDMLDRKDIMFYFNDEKLQNFVEAQGWSGKVVDFDGDYLAVVNTNLGGYKTDRVIEQTINLNIAISDKGLVKNYVEVIRKHLGGDSIYDWYNRVNTNYLRFYTPLESKLLKANGHTIEFISPRIDYIKAKFSPDADILAQEKATIIDSSGFYIAKETGKSTFGAWTYVSPKEELKVAIEYLSVVKVDLLKPKYQLYLQKQPGMTNQKIIINIFYPKNWSIAWNFPNNLNIEKGKITYQTILKYDEIISLNFSPFLK